MNILEKYESAQSQLNIQRSVQQYILDYGVVQTGEIIHLFNSLTLFTNICTWLIDCIDHVIGFCILNRHLHTKIDHVIRQTELNVVKTADLTLRTVLRKIRHLANLHARPDSTSDTMFAANTTTLTASPTTWRASSPTKRSSTRTRSSIPTARGSQQ